MGYKLLAQVVLIIASLVVVFSFTQPTLQEIKATQNELARYSEAVANASQFNARLRELLSIRDSFSSEDMRSLEKLVPVTIDQLEVMRDIESIFASRETEITTLLAQEVVHPTDDVSFESTLVIETPQNYSNVSYQDFEVKFSGTYWQMRDILLLTETSDTLLEVVDLNFDTRKKADVDDKDGTIGSGSASQNGEYEFTIVFRTFGLPIASST